MCLPTAQYYSHKIYNHVFFFNEYLYNDNVNEFSIDFTLQNQDQIFISEYSMQNKVRVFLSSFPYMSLVFYAGKYTWCIKSKNSILSVVIGFNFKVLIKLAVSSVFIDLLHM